MQVRRHWKAVLSSVVLFLIGIGIGAAGGSTSAAESTTVLRTESQVFVETETETVLPGAEEKAKLDEERDRLKKQAAKLDARAKDVRAREKKVARAEGALARSMSGDGTYLVGKDIPAGSYVSPGGEGCYWERSRPGGDIIDNYFGSGQARATVNSGEEFNTQGCGTWRRG